jgi:general stress protein 26
MRTPQELERKFWKALKTDMTLMLGLDGIEDGHARPMTAQLEHDDRGPIWFFTANDHAIVPETSPKQPGDSDIRIEGS